jgi:hypothetical protein
MSVHDPSAGRKPWRLGLYLPFAFLLVAAVAWSGLWLWARAEAQSRMDAAVADFARAGYQVSWKSRALGGYPFRLDVSLTDAEVREPSGWALQAPRLESEAYLYAPTNWLLAAPQGLTFVRPQAGPVTVAARSLRASLTHLDARPPSLSIQAVDASFQPTPGALPFSLLSAGKVELHLRAGPDDQGGVFFSLENGRARPGGLVGRLAGDKPVSIAWNATLSKISAFTGGDWADAVRRWTEAGGAMSVRPGSQFVAGPALAAVRSGTLSAGRDGRLRGVLDLDLRQAPQALGAMAETGLVPTSTAEAARAVADARQTGDLARIPIAFEAGQTTLGPVALSPAPKVYTPP